MTPHTSVSVIDRNFYNKIKSGYSNDMYATPLGYSLIRISPNMEKYKGSEEMKTRLNRPVIGLLTNDFTYSISSEWDAMQYPQILDMGIFKDLTAFSGGGEIGAVFRTKKIWKKSGDLTITPELRIIDVNGTGAALQAANQLMLFCVASGERNFISKNLYDKFEHGVHTSIDTVADAGKGLTKWDESGSFHTIIDTTRDGMKNALEDLDDYTKLRLSPPTLDVEIGRVFRHTDMVLTNLSFTFSKEVSEKGPLYVDANLTLVSRKIISNINETGLHRSISSEFGTETYKYDINFKGEVKNEHKPLQM